VEFAVEGKDSKFGRRSNIFQLLHLLSKPSDLENRRRPDSFPVGQTQSFVLCLCPIHILLLLLLLFGMFINCISVKCCYSTLCTACFILLYLLKDYVKPSGYFGSIPAAYCVTQIHDLVQPGVSFVREITDYTGQIREARAGSCARQGRAELRGKAGTMREERPGSCARQGRAYARGRAGQMR
jgi:hypothetical protein